MCRAVTTALVVLAGALVAACPGHPRAPGHRRPAEVKGHAPAKAGSAKADAAGAGDTVYTWYDAEGLPHTAADRSQIPPRFRSRVVVSHLAGGARRALADKVTVADLRGAKPTYSQVDLTRLGAGAAAPDGKALLAHDHQVTIYGTSWCHFCKLARRWLTARHVPFVDKDIEADPKAAAELRAKLKAAGIRFGGVPVLDVRGHLIEGFDPKALAEALRETRPKATPSKAHG